MGRLRVKISHVRFFHGKASQKKISREIFFPAVPPYAATVLQQRETAAQGAFWALAKKKGHFGWSIKIMFVPL